MDYIDSLTVAAIAVCATLTDPAAADEIAEDVINGYFAETKVLDSYPGCDLQGQTPHRITFNAPNLQYSATDMPTRTAIATAQNRRIPESEQCFRLERRGTEQFRTLADCSDDAPRSDPFALLETKDLGISISAEITACLSLTEFKLLDGSWSAQLEAGLDDDTVSGTFWDPADGECVSDVTSPKPIATVDYAISGIWGNPADHLSRRPVGYYKLPRAPAVFQLEFVGIPLSFEDFDTSDLTIRTRASFFPVVNGEAHCPDGLCTLPYHINRIPVGIEPTRCLN